MLPEDRYFDPQPDQKALAQQLYAIVRDMPILSPHGHVDPMLFSQPDVHFANPSALLFQKDHYILRMLHSQGVPYEVLLSQDQPDRAWEVFARHFYLFRGTPSGLWLTHELDMVFGITEPLNEHSAERIYTRIDANLASAEMTPRRLFKKFNLEVLATTDAASDPLTSHQVLQDSGWDGRVIPTFRPDDVIGITSRGWIERVTALHHLAGLTVSDFRSYLSAIERRRETFKQLGATATDIGVLSPKVHRLAPSEANRIYQAGLKGEVGEQDAENFIAHMLFELARMSSEDGLVMQIHPGVLRNHDPQVFARFGGDMGFDFPVRTEFTRNLQPLLADFGHHPNFRLILFTVDESTYSRELAPLAGVYPAVRLGSPWWFLDSWHGIRRYFEAVLETAGLHNTAGFVDDTRAFLSIPARHDLWRRACANWVAGLLIRKMIGEADGQEMMKDLAHRLAKAAYHL